MNAIAFWVLAGLSLRWWLLGRAPRRQEYREAMLDGRGVIESLKRERR
jgi:hypothetical protein